MALRRGYVSLPSGQVHYREAGDGPPIVLLHRTIASAAMFDPILPLLAADRRTVAFDTPGYGQSDPPAGQATISGYAEVIAAACDAFGFQSVPLYGFHTGAAVALDVALHRPDLVSALILGAVPLWSVDERASRLVGIADGSFSPIHSIAPDGGHLLRHWERFRRTQDPAKATRSTIERAILGERANDGFRAVVAYDATAAIRAVRVPVQVLIGTDEDIHAETQAARSLLPKHDYLEVPGFSIPDYPTMAPTFAAVILAFLRRHDL